MCNLILIVDADPAFRSALALALNNAGYGTVEVPSGHTAIYVAETFPDRIGVAIIDLALPGMNGYEVIRWFRRDLPQVKLTDTASWNPNLTALRSEQKKFLFNARSKNKENLISSGHKKGVYGKLLFPVRQGRRAKPRGSSRFVAENRGLFVRLFIAAVHRPASPGKATAAHNSA